MGAMLDKPITNKATREKTAYDVRFGSSAMQGWRVEMEDTHTIIEDMREFQGPLAGHAFVAVYDGHGGTFSSTYAEDRMLSFLLDTPEVQEYCATEEANREPRLLQDAMRSAFLKLDEAMRLEPAIYSGNDRSGSTALAALITPDSIIMAHAGDSRGIVCNNGKVVMSTRDHKPFNNEERDRIEAAGGHVFMRRVDGDLAVSRALGDFQYKDKHLPAAQCKVTALPDISLYERHEGDELLVLGCDGIWDVMTNEECSTEILRLICEEGESSVGLVCEEILDICLQKNSRDNMSTVIVLFPGVQQGSGTGVLGRRHAREEEDNRTHGKRRSSFG